jgi:hypothetical protein
MFSRWYKLATSSDRSLFVGDLLVTLFVGGSNFGHGALAAFALANISRQDEEKHQTAG